jgi:hypothetical protein
MLPEGKSQRRSQGKSLPVPPGTLSSSASDMDQCSFASDLMRMLWSCSGNVHTRPVPNDHAEARMSTMKGRELTFDVGRAGQKAISRW